MIGDLFDENILPLFCVLTHFIWTIVPLVILDQCCTTKTNSLLNIVMKLFVCTFPLLICSELSLIVVCLNELSRNHLLFIGMKWLIFLSTILMSFWTGILNDQTKWRGIHGGQIAPERHSPLYQFEYWIISSRRVSVSFFSSDSNVEKNKERKKKKNMSDDMSNYAIFFVSYVWSSLDQ